MESVFTYIPGNCDRDPHPCLSRMEPDSLILFDISQFDISIDKFLAISISIVARNLSISIIN